MSDNENCTICGSEVKTMVHKGTGVCGEICRKKRDGETDGVRSQVDAGITGLIREPQGINLNGIR